MTPRARRSTNLDQANYTWDESVILTTPSGSQADSRSNPVTFTLTGAHAFTLTPDPQQQSCSVTFTGNSGLVVDEPLVRITVVPGSPGSIHAYATPPIPAPAAEVKPSVSPVPNACKQGAAPGGNTDDYNPTAKGDPQYQGLLQAHFDGPISTPSYSQHFSVNDASAAHSCEPQTGVPTTCTDTIMATATFSLDNAGTGVGGVPLAETAPPPTSEATSTTAGQHNTPQELRDAARADLPFAIDAAKGPCLHEAIALGLMATGAVTMNVLALSPLGIPTGASLIAIGQLVGSALAPLCTPLLGRIAHDLEVWNDPPLADVDHVASALDAPRQAPPSCGSLQGRLQTFCVELGTAAAKLVDAAQHVAAVGQALGTSVGRERAALSAGNGAAVDRQERAERDLEDQLNSALRVQATDGAAVAGLLRREHIDLRLTPAQASEAISVLLTDLSKQGVFERDLPSERDGARSGGRGSCLSPRAPGRRGIGGRRWRAGRPHHRARRRRRGDRRYRLLASPPTEPQFYLRLRARVPRPFNCNRRDPCGVAIERVALPSGVNSSGVRRTR